METGIVPTDLIAPATGMGIAPTDPIDPAMGMGIAPIDRTVPEMVMAIAPTDRTAREMETDPIDPTAPAMAIDLHVHHALLVHHAHHIGTSINIIHTMRDGTGTALIDGLPGLA